MTTFAPIDSMITDFQAALPTTTPVGPATLTTTVPKEYVHRSAVTEVFLTGWRQTDADTCTVTAQWPGPHLLRARRRLPRPAAVQRDTAADGAAAVPRGLRRAHGPQADMA
ncbi:hypothetical protein ACFQ3Z_36010 [Streptomyces nogalater]